MAVVTLKGGFKRAQMKARDVRVSDDGTARRPEPRTNQLTGTRQQAGTDQHIVRAFAQRHVDGADVMQGDRAHRATSVPAVRCRAKLSMISLTITSCGTSRLSTVMSASAYVG